MLMRAMDVVGLSTESKFFEEKKDDEKIEICI